MNLKIRYSNLLPVILCTCTIANTSEVVANTLLQPLSSRVSNFFQSPLVTTLSVGAAWAEAGDTKTFFLPPDIEKTYAANKTHNLLGDVELFLGVKQPLYKKLDSQMGLAVSTTSNARFSGHVWDDADPQFDNYKYRYKVRHTEIVLKGIVFADLGYAVTPWIAASVGLGFNRAHAFTNTPLIDSAIAMPNFSNNTATSLAYSVSFGIQKQLVKHWKAGIGYKFSDWGNSRLGKASGQIFNNRLSESHLYTNGIVFNISYTA